MPAVTGLQQMQALMILYNLKKTNDTPDKESQVRVDMESHEDVYRKNYEFGFEIQFNYSSVEVEMVKKIVNIFNRVDSGGNDSKIICHLGELKGILSNLSKKVWRQEQAYWNILDASLTMARFLRW